MIFLFSGTLNYAVITGITTPPSTIEGMDFNLYPNPSSGKAYLFFATPLQEDYSLKIINNIGRLVENRVLERGMQYDVCCIILRKKVKCMTIFFIKSLLSWQLLINQISGCSKK